MYRVYSIAYRVEKDKKINAEYKMWVINVGLGIGIADSV